MRFRRLTFGLIPPKFSTDAEEQEYISKFKRLLEYLCKLKETDSAVDDIKIMASTDPEPNLFETRYVTGLDSMRRSTVQLRKGKHDPFEWIELATDNEFSTRKSYRVIFNWLAASSGKVDAQVQLLHRRCTQYGLSLITFPQTSISRDLLLNPVSVCYALLFGSLCPSSSSYLFVGLCSSRPPLLFVCEMTRRRNSCTHHC